MSEEFEVLELNQKTDILAVQCKCPKCGDKYMQGVPYVQVGCGHCGITYKTNFIQDIYTKIARRIVQKLAYKDGLILKADEEYEMDVTNIRHHFIKQRCWDVSEIENKERKYMTCLNCGICLNCLTCKDCKETFPKHPNLKKQVCPKCRKSNVIKTYFKKPLSEDQRFKCPKCRSNNIKLTNTNDTSKCHKCNSKKLSSPKSKTQFQFTIQRKKAYREENF